MTQGLTISNKEFQKAILELEAAFRVPDDRKIDNDQTLVWFKYLKNLTPDQLSKAVHNIIYNDQWFPPISRILEAAGVEGSPAPRALTEKDIENMSS